MTNLESSNENLTFHQKGLPETEENLLNLKSITKLNGLETTIQNGRTINQRNNPKIGKFEYKNDSKNKKYKVYSYIVKNGGDSDSIKDQAINQGIIKEKEGVLITDRHGIPYDENYSFSNGKKIYIKVPKNTENTPTSSNKNTPTGNNENGESQTNFTSQSTQEISQPIPTIQENHLDTQPISTTPNIEKQRESIEMRCKGGEYYGIDISVNNTFNLDEFKKWNRNKRDDQNNNERGVSFAYIRASDGISKTDSKLNSHIEQIKNYNNDEKVIKNKEKIAVGFYHRLDCGNGLDLGKDKKGEDRKSINNAESIEQQADRFIAIYNENKGKCGGNNLLPMCDVESLNTKKDELKWMNKLKGENKKENKERVRKCVLKWLEKVEAGTGVVPGIYIGLSNYNDYIQGDSRFNKYQDKIRISAYSGKRKKRFSESGAIDKNKEIKPTIYQSSETGKVPGTGNAYGKTDEDHVKKENMENLIVK